MCITTEKKKDSVFQNGTGNQKLEIKEPKTRNLETFIATKKKKVSGSQNGSGKQKLKI